VAPVGSQTTLFGRVRHLAVPRRSLLSPTAYCYVLWQTTYRSRNLLQWMAGLQQRRCRRRLFVTKAEVAVSYSACPGYVGVCVYTTPLSTLISSISFDDHLYADDTQLFSFHPFKWLKHFTFKTLFNTSVYGWLLIFLLLTPLRLISCSFDSKTNLPKHTILHLTPPTLLEIWALSFTNILYLLWRNYISLQSLLLSYSLASLYPALPRFVNCLYHCYLYCSLQTWLL